MTQRRDAPRVDDICPAPDLIADPSTQPLSSAVYLASVYRCAQPDEAQQMLDGELPGYVYQRDGHPNADLLADKCRRLHDADWAHIAGSGMAAMALAVLSRLEAGDHVIVSHQLYGRSLQLLSQELQRLGISSSLVDTSDLTAAGRAMTEATRMIVVETISNPLLRVADLSGLAEVAHAGRAELLVDNTFATPYVARPLAWGADLVLESISKMINGHSDVMLGLLCGSPAAAQRSRDALSVWGLASSPFDCWLAARGLATMHLRVERACENALRVAQYLQSQPAVTAAIYPGLADHADHELATRQFGNRFGIVVSFHLQGGRAAAEQFISGASQIPFCPSLGEVSTTLTHPASTSHRRLSPPELAVLGITEGTIRLSVGTESVDSIVASLQQAFDSLA